MQGRWWGVVTGSPGKLITLQTFHPSQIYLLVFPDSLTLQYDKISGVLLKVKIKQRECYGQKACGRHGDVMSIPLLRTELMLTCKEYLHDVLPFLRKSTGSDWGWWGHKGTASLAWWGQHWQVILTPEPPPLLAKILSGLHHGKMWFNPWVSQTISEFYSHSQNVRDCGGR